MLVAAFLIIILDYFVLAVVTGEGGQLVSSGQVGQIVGGQ